MLFMDVILYFSLFIQVCKTKQLTINSGAEGNLSLGPATSVEVGGSTNILLHRETLGGQLHTYCYFMPCGSEQIL